MKTFAHLVDGVVREVVQIPDGAKLSDCFQADFASQLVGCDASVQQGWSYSGKAFAAAIPPAPTVAQLMAYANEKQWALATGGYTANIGGQGLLFATDERSQPLLDGKVTRLGQANPPATIKWQFPAGFVTLAAADFLSAAIAAADFVQATFDALDAVFAEIEGGTIATFVAVDQAAWPVNHA
jgi:hypothetical protein